MLRLRALVVLTLFCPLSAFLAAQAPGTGLYAFGSFDHPGFDTINIGNLNTHFEIPIVSKPGRGQAFTYTLVYDGLVWSSTTSAGTGYWQPDPAWGLRGQLGDGFVGYLNYFSHQIKCFADPPGWYWSTSTRNYIYSDAFGQQHQLNYATDDCQGTTTGDGSTSDGSGYRFNGMYVVDRHGRSIVVPQNTISGSGSLTDTNGNVINNNGNGTFTDTLGVTALTIAGAGSASSPRTFTYNVANQSDGSTTATATLYYVTYTVQTNFGCSGVSESGAASVDLADHLSLADGSTYSFTYETTPGVSGAVTGRLASVTLPTGGTINYSYTGSCSGGINLDGTVNSLTRTTTDGSRSYSRAPVNANASSTTVQDEKGNQTLYQFTAANGLFYETHQGVYQGAIGGPNLLDKYTCYNGAPPDCSGSLVTPPFTQTLAVTSYNNGVQDSVQNTYDSSGMLTTSIKGQWGASTLQSTTYSYNSLGEMLSYITKDGPGNVVASASYEYDETAATGTSGIPQHGAASGTRGNQTSSHVMTGSGTIDTATTFYDTGVPVSATTPNGTTQYSYDSTQTFATQTVLPTPSSGVGLATTASYDQQSGALISATGVNSGQTIQVTQYDRMLRPTVASLPNGSQINYNYSSYSSNDTEINQTRGTGANADNHTLVDAYGRKSRTAIYNGQTPGSDWYQVDYCYDASGLLQFQSTMYQGSGFGGANATKQCSGSGTTYSYDALGRLTSSTNVDGTSYQQYNGRAVKTTDVNGVQKITQYDLLGRISAICDGFE